VKNFTIGLKKAAHIFEEGLRTASDLKLFLLSRQVAAVRCL
jgi:hypothetical protein